MKIDINRMLVKIGIALLFILPILFSLALSAHATNYGGNTVFETTLANPIKDGPTNFFTFLQQVFNTVIIPIGGIVAALAIIYSGFLFVMAQGNPAKITTARNALLWSIIGTAVLLGSWALSEGIKSTITCIKDGC